MEMERKKDEKEKPSTFENILGTLGKMANGWSRVVEAFKSGRSSELKETLIGKGFEAFSQSAQIQVSKGIKEEHLERYVNNLATRIKVPDDRKGDLVHVLEDSMITDSNVWNCFDTAFSVDAGGNVKFASILSARNEETGKYDFIFSDITSTFNLLLILW